LRQFLQIGLDEPTPDHVTISTHAPEIDEGTQQAARMQLEVAPSLPQAHCHLNVNRIVKQIAARTHPYIAQGALTLSHSS